MQDIKGTLFNITKSVTKTSGDLLKTTKLNMSLSSEEAALKNLYMEIGKKVHEIYQYGGSLGKFFDEKYLEIEASERKIADLKEQIGVIKGTRACPKCGKSVDRAAEFCQKCGVRVELEHTPVDVAGAGAPQAAPAEFAPSDFVPSTEAPPIEPPPMASPAPVVPAPTPVVQTPALRTCRVCSSQNESGTKFCISCGRILD
ncbi:MAG: zinc ribbon domain-containing protein [Defluviitaleaceae bacterium]|nr:zinc ribbon domain-containing protein [Defluviitaleaceae bacterium]